MGTPLEGTNGVVWYRKKVDVPANMTGLPAKTILGCIVDADSVFINGTFVGTTSFTDTFDLRGEWRYRIGVVMPPLASQTFSGLTTNDGQALKEFAIARKNN